MLYRGLHGRILPEGVSFDPYELDTEPLDMPDLSDEQVLVGGNLVHTQADPEKPVEDVKACLSRRAILEQMFWSEFVQPGELTWYTLDRNDAVQHGLIE